MSDHPDRDQSGDHARDGAEPIAIFRTTIPARLRKSPGALLGKSPATPPNRPETTGRPSFAPSRSTGTGGERLPASGPPADGPTAGGRPRSPAPVSARDGGIRMRTAVPAHRPRRATRRSPPIRARGIPGPGRGEDRTFRVRRSQERPDSISRRAQFPANRPTGDDTGLFRSPIPFHPRTGRNRRTRPSRRMEPSRTRPNGRGERERKITGRSRSETIPFR